MGELTSELGVALRKVGEERVEGARRSMEVSMGVLQYATNENRKSLDNIQTELTQAERRLDKARNEYGKVMAEATNAAVKELGKLRKRVELSGGIKDKFEREYGEVMKEYEDALNNWDRVKREQVSIRGEFEEREKAGITNYLAKRTEYEKVLKEYYSNYGVLEEKLGEKEEVGYWVKEYREYGSMVSNILARIGEGSSLGEMEEKLLGLNKGEVSSRGGVTERIERVMSELVRREVGEEVGLEVMGMVVGDGNDRSNAAYRVIRGEYGAGDKYGRFEVTRKDLTNKLIGLIKSGSGNNNQINGNIDWEGVRFGLVSEISNKVFNNGDKNIFISNAGYYKLGEEVLKLYEAYMFTFESGYTNLSNFDNPDRRWKKGYVRRMYEKAYLNEWKREGEAGIKHLGIMGAYSDVGVKISGASGGKENEVLRGISNRLERLSKAESYLVGVDISGVVGGISNLVWNMRGGVTEIRGYVNSRGGMVYGVMDREMAELGKAIESGKANEVSNILARIGEGRTWGGGELAGWISELENLEREWNNWSKVGVVVSNRMAALGEIEGVERASYNVEIEDEVKVLSEQWAVLSNIEGIIWGIMDGNMDLVERIEYYRKLTNELARSDGILVNRGVWGSRYGEERTEILTNFAKWLGGRGMFNVLYGGDEKMRGLLEIYNTVAKIKEGVRSELGGWRYAYNYEGSLKDLVLDGASVQAQVAMGLGTNKYEAYYRYRLEQLGRRSAAVWEGLWETIKRMEEDGVEKRVAKGFVEQLRGSIKSNSSVEGLVSWVSNNYVGVVETNEWYSDAAVKEYTALMKLEEVKREGVSIAKDRGEEEWKVLIRKALQEQPAGGQVLRRVDDIDYMTGKLDMSVVNRVVSNAATRNKGEQAEYYKKQVSNILVNAIGVTNANDTLKAWLETSGVELAAAHATNLLKKVESAGELYLAANSNYLRGEKEYNEYYEKHYVGGLKDAKEKAGDIEVERAEYEKLRAVYEYGLMLNLAGVNEESNIARKVGRKLLDEVERTNRLDDPLDGISERVMGYEITGRENEVGIYESTNEVKNSKMRLGEILEKEMIYQAYEEYQKSVGKYMVLKIGQEELSNSYRKEREEMRVIVTNRAITQANELKKWGELSGRMEVENGKLDYEVGVYDKEYREAESRYKGQLAKLITNGSNNEAPGVGYRVAEKLLDMGEFGLNSKFDTEEIKAAIASGSEYVEQMKRFRDRYWKEEGGRISNLRRYDECKRDLFDWRCQRFIDRRRAAEREKERAAANFNDMKRQYEGLLAKVRDARDNYYAKKTRNENYSQNITYTNYAGSSNEAYQISYKEVYSRITGNLANNEFLDIFDSDLENIDPYGTNTKKYNIVFENISNKNTGMLSYEVSVSTTMKKAFSGYVDYLNTEYKSAGAKWKEELKRKGQETNLVWEESTSDIGYRVAMGDWAKEVSDVFGYIPNAVNLEEAEAVYSKLMLDIVPIAGGSKLATELLREYTKVLNIAHQLKQMQTYTLQKEEWDKKEKRVNIETKKYVDRINALLLTGGREWSRDLADFEAKWGEWDRKRMGELADGELAYREQLIELRRDEADWKYNVKNKSEADIREEVLGIRARVSSEIGIAQRKAEEERKQQADKERQEREEIFARAERELAAKLKIEREQEQLRIAAAQAEGERFAAIEAVRVAEEKRKRDAEERRYREEQAAKEQKQREERKAEAERVRISKEVEKLNFARGDLALEQANRKQFFEDIDNTIADMYGSYSKYIGKPKEMKEVQALQSMEVKLKDKYNRINEKYAVRTPRVRDYYAMRRISFQPTSGDELKILEELNRQVEADNQELMKQRLFEMMEEFHREQGEFIEERQEDMNRNHDLMIAKEYLFVDIHEQMKKMGVSDDATTRKLNRIEEILRNHQLYGEYGVKYRNDEEVGYERNYITDASLFLEAIGKHSLVGFRYAKESTYLTSPLSEWNEVAGMSYVEVKMWQVSYQQRLSQEMRSVVDDINEYFGEDFNRFMGEYSELFGEYMAGVSKADIPFWKKKLFLGEELAFLSLSSIFDLIMGVAGIFTGGATIAIISAVKGVTEAIGSKAYYGQDMSDGDFLMQIGMAGVSYGMSYLPGAGDLVKGASMGVQVGVTVGMAAAKTTISTGADFLMRGMFKNDWSLDGEAFARDLGIGSLTAAAMMGMSGIERQTGSSFLSSGATMAVRGGITALGNTIYGEATGRRVSGFMETTGTSMADIGGLMGSGVKDAKRYDDSKKYRDEKYTVQEGMKMVMIDEEKAALESMKSKANTEAELEMIKSQIKKLEEEQKGIVGEKEQRERRNVPIFPVALPIAAGRRSWRNRNENEEGSGEDDEWVYEAIREGSNLANGEGGPEFNNPQGRSMTVDKDGTARVKVNQGDTLTEIAKEFGVTVEELLKANPHISDPNKIRAGDNIRLPDERVSSSVWTERVSRDAERDEWEKAIMRRMAEKKAKNKDLIYGDKVSAEFAAKVKDISQDLGIDPDHLMAVMAFETGGSFSASEKNRAGSGATGLIQFMSLTAESLGTSTEELKNMSAVKQLDYVKKYLSDYKGKMNSLEDVYLAVLSPRRGLGKDGNYELFKTPQKAYRQNKGFDKNDDGTITIGEIKEKIKKYYDKGLKRR